LNRSTSDAPRPELALARVVVDGATTWAVRRAETWTPLAGSLSDLLRLPAPAARRVVEAADGPEVRPERLLAPVDPHHEVWAAGVTYRRSRDARIEESHEPDVYDRVYAADRPELFFKSTGVRVRASGEDVGIRADSPWNVPESELGLVLHADGDLFGYVPGNDASSRSIEGENLLYLPQAKVYTGACALGPEIVPAWTTDPPFGIALRIRRGGETVFDGTTSTAQMARGLDELADWLFRALDFPDGVVLLTGTGVVPDAEFTLRPGDEVAIEVEGIGTLHNGVMLVGRPEERTR
jgi:2-dehydro-3-deoxy-D-arabinonate dehydratase